MRAPLKVLITVDTEAWPRGEAAPGGPDAFRRHIERDIYGRTPSGDFGVGYQIDVLNAHGLKGVYFVESMFPDAVGVEPLRDLVTLIQAKGQEVQLHLHTEWLKWLRDSVVALAGRTGQNMKDFSEDEQAALLARGLDNLRRAGATGVCAFRAGNYGADFATLRALARNEVTFDTSYNACYVGAACGIRLDPPLVQTKIVEGVYEVPISFFQDYPGHRRHAQLCAASFGELRQAISKAWEAGWDTFVIVSHSFELLRRNRDRIPETPDPIVIKRYEKLCEFLGRNKDRFETAGFSDLEPASLVRSAAAPEIRTSVVSTALRVGAQLIRRARR